MEKDSGANPALVASQSSQQVVSTEGFDPGELLALAERCEASSGPNPDIDDAIKIAIPERRYVNGIELWPRYTRSVDGAMSLVPAGWLTDATERNCGSLNAIGRDWVVRLFGVSDDYKTVVSRANTFALAVTAAALKARALAPTLTREGRDA